MEKSIVQTGAGPVTVHRTPGDGGAPGSRTATLLLHGAAGSWTTWAPMIAATAAAEGGVPPDLLIPDLPGWGDSPADPGSLDAGVLARATAEVARAFGYERWRVAGHSLGGFVALELAAAEPSATEDVVLVSATTFGGRADTLGLGRLLAAYSPLLLLNAGMRALAAWGSFGMRLVRVLDRTGLLGRLTAPLFARAVPGVVHELARDLRPAAFVRAVACASVYPAVERWSRIRCGVVAVRGSRDVFVPASDDGRLAAIIPGLRTIVVPGTGHFAHVEHPSLLARLCLPDGGGAGGGGADAGAGSRRASEVPASVGA
ncbi:alpha/beta fold hydrolase [Leifsonia xyli]|uniref:alpha/beta fold hydrolase n=1 Tax=Leifsonia xyli TaxID=1575 RepID=UPI003D66F7C7